MTNNENVELGQHWSTLTPPVRFKVRYLLQCSSCSSPYKGRSTGVEQADPLGRYGQQRAAVVEKSRNVVSHVCDSGLPAFRRRFGWPCRGRGFAGSLDAVSDSLAALERISGAPTAPRLPWAAVCLPASHAIPRPPGSRTLQRIIKIKQVDCYPRLAVTHTACRCQPYVGRRREPARSDRMAGPSLEIQPAGPGGENSRVGRAAPKSPAHHLRLLSGSKKGKFPENILEKPSAARKSLEIIAGRPDE
jgi:hypothetical protein